jgi:hypothetical protein
MLESIMTLSGRPGWSAPFQCAAAVQGETNLPRRTIYEIRSKAV